VVSGGLSTGQEANSQFVSRPGLDLATGAPPDAREVLGHSSVLISSQVRGMSASDRVATFAASIANVRRWRNRDLRVVACDRQLSGNGNADLYGRDQAQRCHSQRGQ
jgi:hypothetical protein